MRTPNRKREALTDRMVIACERTSVSLDRMTDLLVMLHDQTKRQAENLELFARKGRNPIEPDPALSELLGLVPKANVFPLVPAEHPAPPAGSSVTVSPDFLAKVERWGQAITAALASWETLLTNEETAADREALEGSYHGRSMKALLEAFNS